MFRLSFTTLSHVAAGLLVVGLAAARQAAAQGSTADPLRAQVDALVRRMPAGIRLLREPWMGALAQDSTADAWVDLAAGSRYHFTWVCDQDCADLDLRMYDAAGTELAHASDTDDLSILSITPASSGRYRLRVWMLSCAAAPCRWGVAMFGREPGGG